MDSARAGLRPVHAWFGLAWSGGRWVGPLLCSPATVGKTATEIAENSVTMFAPTVEVRRARPEDAESVRSLYRQLLGSSNYRVLPEQIQELQDCENSLLLVAEVAGRVCGTLLLSLCADVMYARQPFAVIENVVVDQGFRKCGIGAALLEQAESFYRQSQCSKMMLLSFNGRVEAHRFFESQGFDSSAKRGFVKYRRDFNTEADL